MSGKGKKDLSKLFQSTGELEKPEVSSIEGTIPPWVRGSFIRCGPGAFDLGDFTMNHWLDGYAVITKFKIEEKSVTYSKKYLQSDSFKRAMKSQKPVVTEFGTKAYPEKGKGFFARFVSALVPEMSDNDISNIFQMGDKVFVANDSCFFRNIEPCSLGTGERFDANKIFGLNGLSAHPLVDKYGDLYNVGFSVLSGLKFSVVKIPAKDKSLNLSPKEMIKDAVVVCTIPSSYKGGVSFVHSFGMTDNYIIFIEQPYLASVTSIALTLIKGYSVKDWMEWKPHLLNRFHVVNKRTGEVLKVEYVSDEPFFFLHVVNSYHDKNANQLVVDIIALRNPDILDGMYMSKLRKGIVEPVAQPACHRFVIPLSSVEKCTPGENCVKVVNSTAEAIYSGNKFTLYPEILTEPGCDMPTINKRYLGFDYSYFYVSGTIAKNKFSNAIRKIDLKNKDAVIKEWKGNQYLYPGEPVFVPQTGSTDEDQGILIATVTDLQKNHDDFLVFINAKTMEEIARCKFKEHIPSALHGIFMSELSK